MPVGGDKGEIVSTVMVRLGRAMPPVRALQMARSGRAALRRSPAVLR